MSRSSRIISEMGRSFSRDIALATGQPYCDHMYADIDVELVGIIGVICINCGYVRISPKWIYLGEGSLKVEYLRYACRKGLHKRCPGKRCDCKCHAVFAPHS